MKIKHIKIEIAKERYPDGIIFVGEVQTDKEKYSFRSAYIEDDFSSNYDIMMNIIKEELRKYVQS